MEIIREAKECPLEVQARLTSIGGTNRYDEPMFRLVWGESRLDWDCGKWTDFDESGNEISSVIEDRRVPKYNPENRWYLERWIPPETYGSPEKWRQDTLEVFDGIPVMVLGPYPSRGDYEQVSGGCYMSLIPVLIEDMCRRIEASRLVRPADALVERIKYHEKKWDKYRNDVYEGLRGMNKPFFGRPFTPIKGTRDEKESTCQS